MKPTYNLNIYIRPIDKKTILKAIKFMEDLTKILQRKALK